MDTITQIKREMQGSTLKWVRVSLAQYDKATLFLVKLALRTLLPEAWVGQDYQDVTVTNGHYSGKIDWSELSVKSLRAHLDQASYLEGILPSHEAGKILVVLAYEPNAEHFAMLKEYLKQMPGVVTVTPGDSSQGSRQTLVLFGPKLTNNLRATLLELERRMRFQN